MTTLQPAITQKYSLGPVKSWVQNAANLIGPMFNIKTIYGWRKTDPFPDHPSGHALDFMVPDQATGDRLASFVIANHDALGVKYLIWWHRYWDPNVGWQPYTATSNPHTDHVHVTFLDTPGPAIASPGSGTGLSTDTGNITLASNAVPISDGSCAWQVNLFGFDGCVISTVNLGKVVGIGIMLSGLLTLGVGIILLTVFGLQHSNIPGASLVTRYIPR